MVSFNFFFLKSMTPCLLKLKVTPGFYFQIVIPDNVTASIKYITLSFLKCCATTYKEDKIRWGSFQESTFYCQLLLLQRPTYILILSWIGIQLEYQFGCRTFQPWNFQPQTFSTMNFSNIIFSYNFLDCMTFQPWSY